MADKTFNDAACCPDVPLCPAYIADAVGVAAPAFEPFNVFTVKKAPCCVINVTTSAGSFTMLKDETLLQSETFTCLLDSISYEVISDGTVDGSCADSVHIIVQNTGI